MSSNRLLLGFAVVAVVALLGLVWVGVHLASALRGPSLQPVAVRTELTAVPGGTRVTMTVTPSGSSSLPEPVTVRLTRRDQGQADDGGPQPTGAALSITGVQGSGKPAVHPETNAIRVDGLRVESGAVRLSFQVGTVAGRRVAYPSPNVDGAAVRRLSVLGSGLTCSVAGGGGDPPGVPHYTRGRLAADGRLTGTDGNTRPARCELAGQPTR